MSIQHYVVRAGLARPNNLINGTTPHRDIPDLTGFSVQSAPNVSVAELARAGGYRNGMISVTTVADLSELGVDVIFPTPGKGLYHATVFVPYPLLIMTALQISRLFKQRPNPYSSY